ncbi:unnamed protein product [Pieris brassicae]|uniref:Uncharacterized protein n=1 Tax=Pieris brassicae TaxID=7116 RepID=A0A9P0SQH6_PIEBR|nr:unnamed protein product [Pieris brassicae]
MKVIKQYKALSIPRRRYSTYSNSGHFNTTYHVRPESQLSTNESLPSLESVPNTVISTNHSYNESVPNTVPSTSHSYNESVPNTVPSTSHSYNFSGYSTITQSQLEADDSLLSLDSDTIVSVKTKHNNERSIRSDLTI